MLKHIHSELQSEKYVVFVDAARRYVDCSDEVCNLVGYTRTEILSKNIDDLTYNRSCVPPLFEKYLEEGLQNGEYILKHKDGRPIVIHYSAWVFADGCNAAAWKPAEEWEQFYLAALIETHPGKLRDKVNVALGAIHKRQLEFGDEERPQIRQKLRDASSALRALLR